MSTTVLDFRRRNKNRPEMEDDDEHGLGRAYNVHRVLWCRIPGPPAFVRLRRDEARLAPAVIGRAFSNDGVCDAIAKLIPKSFDASTETSYMSVAR